ncbi:MAG: ATP-binding protein [Bacillota bacterium]
MTASTPASSETSSERVYCPHCGEDKTPYQRQLGRRVFTIDPECRCDREARDKAIAEEEARRREEDLRQRIEQSGLPARYQRATFEAFEPARGTEKAVAICREYAASFARGVEDGLLVRGPKGAGKTHLAAAVALSLLQSGFRVAFWNVPLVLDEIRSSFGARSDKEERASEIMERARRADLLILDDIGTEKPSEWVVERLYLVVEMRYQDLKPLIVTTNASMKELEEALSPKTVSRLVEMCRGVSLEASDYRARRIRGR